MHPAFGRHECEWKQGRVLRDDRHDKGAAATSAALTDYGLLMEGIWEGGCARHEHRSAHHAQIPRYARDDTCWFSCFVIPLAVHVRLSQAV